MSGLLQTATVVPSARFPGRRQELKFFSTQLGNFSGANTSMLLIEGEPGIGKTSLVKKSLENYNRNKCFKLYGKFENHRENTPYLAFRQAFSDWANQILLLNDEEFNELKENTTSALQTNISAITSVFKELEIFFSRKQMALNTVYKADSHQIKARFYYSFKKFLRSITSLGYRIIFFLDDVQWADRASMLLIEELMLKNEIPDLIFITSFRPVTENTSFQAEKILRFKGMPRSSYLRLKPLQRRSVKSIIPARWNFSEQNREAFSKYLWHGTRGNPFKINEIIKAVQRQRLSSYLTEENPLFWENLPKLDSREDSLSFMQQQLKNLPGNELRVLSAASCIGFSFKPDILKAILNLPETEVDHCLLHLTGRDLLIRKGRYHLFAHDTIFSAAASFLSDAEKEKLHRKAGAYLLKKIPVIDQHGYFQAVNHINTAWQLSTLNKPVAGEHILLNINAAGLAIKNSAVEIARKYYLFADDLFSKYPKTEIKVVNAHLLSRFKTAGIKADNIKFSILFGLAETMFLSQKFELALGYINRARELNITRHQKISATLIQIRICSALIYQKDIRNILLDGLTNLEQVLKEFGIVFPTDPEELLKESVEDCKKLSAKTAEYDNNRDFSGLINQDREYQDLLTLIMTSMTFLYYMDVKKNMYMAIKALLMCLEKGYAPVVPVLFSASFLTSSFSEENRILAHKLGRMSLKMIGQEPFKRYTHVVYYVATLNFFAWENHYRTCIEKLEMSIQLALEAGDPHYASFCSTNIRLLNCYRGKNLEKHLEYSEELEKNHHVFFISSSDNDLAKHLIGTKPGFGEGNFEFSKDLILESEFNMSSRYHLNLALQKLNYLSGHHEAALAAGEVCENLENVYSGFQIELEHYFFYSLSLLKAVSKTGNLPEALLKVTPKLEEFRRLSEYRSGNYYHKVLLLEAEIARCRDDFEQATLLYDKAIAEAKKQGFVHHAAIAAELAFEYYLLKERKTFARHYLDKAIKFYTRWGAKAKVDQLKTKFSGLVKKGPPGQHQVLPAVQYELIKAILDRTVPGKKTELPELGQFLISRLITQSKATKGAILKLQENVWRVLATGNNEPEILKKPLRDLKMELPVKLLNFSLKKGEKLLLEEPHGNPLFADDPYLTKVKPLNIYILPVNQNSQITGLIFLENLSFTSGDEYELFGVIAELAATTFANAVHFENNEVLNEELKQQERHKIEAIIETQEKERQRIARELHDSLGQMLALIKIKISCLDPEYTSTKNSPVLADISRLIDESCDEVRSISYNLMPPDLKEKGLTENLENLIKKNQGIHGIIFHYRAYGISGDLTEAIKFTLYRVLQEILQNTVKHACASKVAVSLTQTDDLINLLVEDNGKGFDMNLTTLGLGLKNIHSRIKLLNGYLDVDSSINNGTVFNVSIPLKP